MSYQNGKCQSCDAYGETDEMNLCDKCYKEIFAEDIKYFDSLEVKK